MTWTDKGKGRFVFEGADQERHLLLRDGGKSVEFHGDTVHLYDELGDDFDPVAPLANANWSGTHVRPELLELSDAGAWREMAAYL